MIPYGQAPHDLGIVDLDPVEMMCYLYLPVRFPNGQLAIPERLRYLEPMIVRVMEDASKLVDIDQHYIYVTAKTLFVHGEYSGNRPGWHADGFGSHGDLNYIYHDMNPTEFAIQDFHDIPEGDVESMIEMEKQIDPANIVTYPCRHILRLDESVVHRVNPKIESGLRTFIKISVSKNRFNLRGNSHNYLLDYDWDMAWRNETRNLDSACDV